MFSHSYWIIGGIKYHGLKKHKAVVFHLGELYSHAQAILSADCGEKSNNQTGFTTGFMEFQTTFRANGEVARPFNIEAAQAQITRRKMALQLIVGVDFNTASENNSRMLAFFRRESRGA